MRKKLSEGISTCKLEPMCAGGLEGFNFGEEYKFERMKDDKGEYFRMYQEETYSTCTPGIFKKHFKIKEEKFIHSSNENV